MSFFDVEIDETMDISHLLSKSIFQIKYLNKIDLSSSFPSLDNYELLGSTANAIAC